MNLETYRSIFDLTGRVALVAGAGGGIGRENALGLAAFGARVICADVNAAGAAQTAGMIVAEGGVATGVEMDIRSADAIARALAEAGPIDILVSTPSVNVRKPLLDIAEDEFDKIVSLNLKGTWLLMRHVARGMAERGRGSIIVYSSIRAFVVEPGQGVYAATKSGVKQMCFALAAELGTKGVRVNLIAPGVTETPLTAQIKNSPDWYAAYANKNALQRWAQPSEMTGAVIFLASDASSYVTGTVMHVDAGWTAIDGRYTPPL